MGFWKNLWSGESVVDTADHSTLADLIVATQLQSGSYGKQAALGVAAIYRARQLNADIPASIPVKAGDFVLPNTQDRVAETILALEDHGDAYWRLQDGDWSVYKNSDIQARWNDDLTKRVYIHRNSVQLRTDGLVPNLAVLSVNRGADDLTGVGWLESSRIAGLIAEQRWVEEYFANNADPTGLLETPGTLTADEAKKLKSQWVERGDGVRTPAILSGGMSWKATSFDANSSEYVDGHLVGIGDVAAMSGVPPSFLAYSPSGSTLTYSNVSDLWTLYWAQTLRPTYVKRIEDAWAAVIGSEVTFDPEQLLVASLEQRVRSAAELVRTGWEADQSLDVVGLPPIPHSGEIPVTLQPEENQNATR